MPYPAFTSAVMSKRKVSPYKRRTLKEITAYLQKYHKYQVVETKRKFIFDNYGGYNAFKSTNSTPKVIDLTYDFPESKSSRFHSVLDMLPWCRVSQVKHSTTEYHRPCKSHQILVCRCEDGQFLREHVHNACLGRNCSQQSRCRHPRWDRQLRYSRVPTTEGQECLMREVSKNSAKNLPPRPKSPRASGCYNKDAHFTSLKLFRHITRQRSTG